MRQKELIEKSLIYISQNLATKIQVKDLASISNISEFHFYKLFRKATNTTPQKYIERLKLEEARHLIILNPTSKIIQVAFDTGFSSPSYFNQSFKKVYGITPTKFKKGISKKNQKEEFLNESNNNEIEVVYQKSLRLKTWLVNMKIFEKKNWIRDFDIPKNTKTLYGVFLDAPFHKPIEQCRYLIGYSCENQRNDNYQIESGYFSKINIKNKVQDELQNVIKNHRGIEDTGYKIKYPIGIERFTNIDLVSKGHYPISRNLLIPIIRKSQDF